MQITSLLVIIPFLLEPASSLVLPVIPDACTHVSPSDRGDVRCGRLTRIQVDTPTRSWWTKPAVGGNQVQNLSARAPGKKKNSGKDKDKEKEKNKGNKGKGKPKKSSSEGTAEKPGGSSSEAAAEKPEASSSEAPAEKPKDSSPGASTEEPKDSSLGAPEEKPKDSSPGTPTEKPEGSSPGSSEQNKGQFSIPDRTKPQQQGNDQTGGTDNQPGQKLDKGKGKATDDGGEGKPAGVDQKPEGDEQKPEEGEQKPEGDKKKPAGGVPLDPDRKNQYDVPAPGSKKKDKSKDKDHTMYHIVTPNPNEAEGLKRIGAKQPSFFRKIGDGDVNADGRYGTHNPHFSTVQSHGQEPKENGETKGLRPGKVEENATTGAPKPEKDGKKDNKGKTEWYEFTPKTQEEVGDPEKKKAWSGEDLRNNMIEQQDHFKNHKAGDKDDKFGQLTQEMMAMCNYKQCTKGQAPPVPDVITRSIIDKPLLRRRLESLLQERNELFDIAMRR